MQDRYVGDIGDFIKYALLRSLSIDKKLGVAWYYVADESHNADGKHTNYLNDPGKWRNLDPDLFDTLRSIVHNNQRSLAQIENSGIIGNAIFHRVGVPKARNSDLSRQSWMNDMRRKLDGCDIVFLDPDNGILPPNADRSSTNAHKYVLPDELKSVCTGRLAILYQHLDRSAVHNDQVRLRANRLSKLGIKPDMAFHARRGSGRVFYIFNAGADCLEKMKSFAHIWQDHGNLVLDFNDNNNSHVNNWQSGSKSTSHSTKSQEGENMPNPMLNERFAEALSYAARLHRLQSRKGTNIPYIAHLLAVCSLVLEHGGDEDEAIAALLHDTVEDQGGEPVLQEINSLFGERVAQIVDSCSDTDITPKPPWKKRKQEYIKHISHATPSVLLVSCCDKLHNANAILNDYNDIGDKLWDRFNAKKEEQLWYYNQLALAFRARENDIPDSLIRKFETIVFKLSGSV